MESVISIREVVGGMMMREAVEVEHVMWVMVWMGLPKKQGCENDRSRTFACHVICILSFMPVN
jgi:hypothetical protein